MIIERAVHEGSRPQNCSAPTSQAAVGGPETSIMHDYKIEEITELLRLAKTASKKWDFQAE
jgi:hypothetical protein